jgi:hypothetical protein
VVATVALPLPVGCTKHNGENSQECSNCLGTVEVRFLIAHLQWGIIHKDALPQGLGHLFADVQAPRLPVLEVVPLEKWNGDEGPTHRFEVPPLQRCLPENLPLPVVGAREMCRAIHLGTTRGSEARNHPKRKKGGREDCRKRAWARARITLGDFSR